MRGRALAKLVTVAGLGSTLEFYDFIIYAFFSDEIARCFFPAHTMMASLIAAYGVFAVGYLARPIGGLIFSHLGDKFGRKNNFSFSLLIMALSTLCMGLVPTYAHIGVSASLIFFVMRIFQGLSLGAETPGAITYISESVRANRQGLWCSIVFAVMNLGAVLAIFIHIVLNHFLSQAALNAWGWRIPFILGGLLGFLGWQIRRSMQESFAFEQQQWRADVPVFTLLRYYPLRLVAAIMVAMLAGTAMSLLYLYMPSYLAAFLHYHYNIINLNLSIGLVLYTLLMVIFGYFSDRFSRKKTMMVASLGLFFLAFPVYDMLRLNHHPILPLVFAIFALLSGMLMGNVPSLFARLFVTQVRYTGVALSYNLGVSLTAGLVPMLTTILMKYSDPTFAPVVVLMSAALIGMVGLLLIPKGFLNKH